MYKATVFPAGFRVPFAALFVLDYWQRELSLSAIANGFEFLCQSTATDFIVTKYVLTRDA